MSSLDLAVIGNCNIAALINRRAELVWMCFPRLDGDPVFCSLIDQRLKASDGEGKFSIELTDMSTCEQIYLENTAVFVYII
jgi:hypothetical protein